MKANNNFMTWFKWHRWKANGRKSTHGHGGAERESQTDEVALTTPYGVRRATDGQCGARSLMQASKLSGFWGYGPARSKSREHRLSC